ncbi:MAG: bifunctional folylpolyglutamate synthase/dihydrofolate synthase [Eubacterium sp.]|nr:bifunctional folylpolyglutamate synthase/dihydrofolate synthase [Eubacterium sp.]
MNYQEAVDYINEVPKFTQKASVEHTQILLKYLGNPEEGLKIIHIAGTNGKGSTCAYLNAMLMEGGFHVGLFTSPHLVSINERIMLDNVPVSDEVFLDAFLKAKEAWERAAEQENLDHPSYFELTFLLAMIIYKEAGVDYVVMETGLGGRLDATNSVKAPIACAIASISRDHTEQLGDTITQIAKEKAGIIKKGIPCIYDASNPEAAAVMADTCEDVGAPGYGITPEMISPVRTDLSGNVFDFTWPGEETRRLTVHSVGSYQMMNAALAFQTMRVLKDETGLSEEAMAEGLANTFWPGRMETLEEGVIVDGAHNEDGVARFTETVNSLRGDRKVTLLFSAMADKHYKDMIRTLSVDVRPDLVITTKVPGYRGEKADAMAALFRENGLENVIAIEDLPEAFETARKMRGDGLLFIVGSLYLAGEIKCLTMKKN